MNTEFKSEYYDSFPETMENNRLSAEAAPYCGEGFQSTEELIFTFVMFLVC
ncbi:hypothetical protein [Eubacterium sp. 1001713B170207_170306_E7]|uniref:hypothetical protein n=1 Tax=Eubacterium sp. 1001713B170207_170306_E7 TaxID=2787097 RepID=UPI00189A2942|nr:hypothetical protein [Eubacterium sp. 1001713B170207_170306_E7]